MPRHLEAPRMFVTNIFIRVSITEAHLPFHRSVNGNGSEWDIKSEERVQGYHVGAPPECSAWDPSNQSNLAVVSKGANTIHLLRKDDGGKQGRFSKGYTRRYTCSDKMRYQVSSACSLLVP